MVIPDGRCVLGSALQDAFALRVVIGHRFLVVLGGGGCFFDKVYTII